MLHVLVGYFTSRPALKGYARKMNSLLQVCKQLEVLGEPLSKARRTTATSAQLRKERKREGGEGGEKFVGHCRSIMHEHTAYTR